MLSSVHNGYLIRCALACSTHLCLHPEDVQCTPAHAVCSEKYIKIRQFPPLTLRTRGHPAGHAGLAGSSGGIVRCQKKKPDPFRLSFRPKRQKVRIKEEKIFGTIYKSEKESSGLFINPNENPPLPSYLYMSWAPVTSGRPRKSSAKPETRLDLVDLLGWPPAGGGQNMSQEGSAKPARKRSCLMKRICLRYTKRLVLEW